MRAGRSRSWAAWVASALVHALIAVIVLRAGQRSALRVTMEEAVEFDLEIEDAVVPEAPAPVPPDPSPSPSPRRPGRGEKKEAARETWPREAAREDDEIADRSGESSPAPPPPAPSPGKGIDLSFGALPDEVKGKVGGPAGPEETLRARPPGRFDLGALRAKLEAQQDAVANVEKGRSDPVLYDYLRGAKSRFLDDAEKLAEDMTVGPGDMVRAWGRGYLRIVEEVNRGSYSTEAQRAAATDARNEKSAGADALGGYGHARRSAEAGAEQRRTEVCVDVAAGREPVVALRRSSGNPQLDKLSLESFTKAVLARPVPADARRGLACYELRISAYRMPPLPFVSCGVGRAGLTCVWPFKKVTNVRGKLISVEYPPADGGGQAGPSLLRKPR
jgi:hypothetical protein